MISQLSRRARNLALAAVVAFVILFVAMQSLTRAPAPSRGARLRDRNVEQRAEEATRRSPPHPLGTFSYALPAPEVEGLPPNVKPGDRFEVWALWEPPATRRPKLQQLIDEVTVKALVPNIDAQAPASIVFWIDDDSIDELIYAERFATLSVVSHDAKGE